MTLRIVPAVLFLVALPAFSDDWPQFRGPERTGISTEKGLLNQWPDAGPRLLWSVSGIGKGFTHVSVSEGLVFVTGLVDTQGILRTYTPDGKLNWQASYGEEWSKSHPGSRSIPTVHDGLVYVASGIGNVACFKAADGSPVWSLKLFDQYQAPQVMWGYAESLLIVDDKVICTPVGKKAFMVALDRRTGKEVWTLPAMEGESAFCSPVLVKHGVRRMIVTMTDRAVLAISPDDGKLLWSHPYQSPRGNHPDSPIYHEGLLYVASGYGKGAIALALAPDGLGVKLLWEQPRQDPVHGQSILLDGYVYASSHQSSRLWSCLELKSGKLAWEDPAIGKGGSIIAAGGMLYCYSEEGVVGLIRPSPERCLLVSSFKIPLGNGPHWAHPVVANGRLYIRHGDVLMCYDVAGSPPDKRPPFPKLPTPR